jgi:hypothetical protein
VITKTLMCERDTSELGFVKEIDYEIAKKNLPLEHRASQRG